MQVLNTNQELTDEMIVAVLEDVKPRIRSLAFKYNVDFDDLFQDTALKVFQKRDVVFAVEKVQGYIYTLARNMLINDIKHRKLDTLSLDSPLTDEGDFTLMDTLADTVTAGREQDHKSVDYHIKIMHRALHRLPVRFQQYALKRYGLNSLLIYNPTGRQSTRDKDVYAIFRILRHDKQLYKDFFERSK